MLNLIYFTADGRFNKEACAVINDLARQGKLTNRFMTDTLFKDVEISTYEETEDKAVVSIGGVESMPGIPCAAWMMKCAILSA